MHIPSVNNPYFTRVLGNEVSKSGKKIIQQVLINKKMLIE